MTSISNIKKKHAIPLLWGIIGGLVSLVILIILFSGSAEPISVYKIFDFIITPIILIAALWNFRKYKDHQLRFWQGLLVGAQLTILYAFLSALFFLILLTFYPEVVTAFIDERMLELNERKDLIFENMGEEEGMRQFENTMQGIKSINIWNLAADDFLKKTLFGLFLTIIISVILRK